MPSRTMPGGVAEGSRCGVRGVVLVAADFRPNGPLLLVTLDVGAESADTRGMSNITSIYRNTNGNVALLTCDDRDNALSASVSEIPLVVDGKSGREIDTLIRSMGFVWSCNQNG